MYSLQRRAGRPQAIPRGTRGGWGWPRTLVVLLSLAAALAVLVPTISTSVAPSSAGTVGGPVGETAPALEAAVTAVEEPVGPAEAPTAAAAIAATVAPAPERVAADSPRAPVSGPAGPVASPLPTPPSPPAVVAEASPEAKPPEPKPELTADTRPPDGDVREFNGSSVTVSEPRPERHSNVTVALELRWEGQPVEGAAVWLVVRYRTAEERQPAGTATVRTDASGRAAITFNVGEATRDYPVSVDLTALVNGHPVAFQTSFTPR